MSPLARSLAYLRGQNWTAQKVETWNSWARRKLDLWGFDLLAIHPAHRHVTGIQVSTASNIAARRKKLLAMPEVRLWLDCGQVVLLHSWAKRGPRGKRKVWTLKVESLA